MSRERVRPAHADDIDRLLAIHTAAFPDDRGMAARRRNFEQNPMGSFDQLRVLEDTSGSANVVLAHAFLFELAVFFGGRSVRTAGIASVGIAPEARGRGVATRLLDALEAEARARGDGLSLLHPFRQGFYRKRGYAPTTTSTRFEASPRAVPHAWVELGRKATLRAMRGDDLANVQACYRLAAERSTGLFVRPDSLWQRKCLDERRHVIVLADTRAGVRAPNSELASPLRGYVAFKHVQEEAHADVMLEVDELVATDEEARRILFGALGAQRDQVRSIRWAAPDGDPMSLAFDDADRDWGGTQDVEHALGTRMAGPMIKILDVTRALTARGYTPHEATFSLEIDEGAAPPRTMVLRAQRGQASVEATVDSAPSTVPGTPAGTPAGTIRCSTAALSSVLFGAVSARDAARLGWLEAGPVTLESFDALTQIPPFEVVDPF